MSDCEECGYCGLVARKALTVDGEPLAALLKKYGALLDSLVSGDIYSEDTPEPGVAAWEDAAGDAHKTLLQFVPVIFRGAAGRRVMAEIDTAVRASGKGSVGVEDVFRAWLISTPGPFRKEVETKIKELSKA